MLSTISFKASLINKIPFLVLNKQRGNYYPLCVLYCKAKDFKPSKPSTDKNESNSDKNNPSTGASDFVGAAAALAVTSVAAAGALALKGKK